MELIELVDLLLYNFFVELFMFIRKLPFKKRSWLHIEWIKLDGKSSICYSSTNEFSIDVASYHLSLKFHRDFRLDYK